METQAAVGGPQPSLCGVGSLLQTREGLAARGRSPAGGKPAPGMGFRSEAARGSEAAASRLLSFSPAGIPARPHPLAPWSPTPSFNQQRPLLASDYKLTGFGNFITALPWKLTHRFLPISVGPQTCRKADLATATQGP